MVLDERRQALEEQFFQQQNAKHLEQIREQQRTKQAKQVLRETSGISDEELLDALVATGISADTLLAVALVPLVEVAWADGQVQEKERKAIIKAAEDKGVTSGTSAHALLADWLTHKPPMELMTAWKAYISELLRQLSKAQQTVLAHQVVNRATAVARAAGGVLGFNSISKEEKRVLADIQAAMDPA